ncbi:hydroxysqualene dehydroxylase HpnE [Rubripirellula lacrimiformis]|nr:hydroxysqualene dehydroxylase HpnE [Rubripirellula lacrimiformis]
MTSCTTSEQANSQSAGDRKRSVVIVGGGLAGLSAADALVAAAPGELDITVIEAKRSLGGRAGSFTDPQSGTVVDYCQHVAMGCCTNFIALMKRHGLADQMKRFDRLTFLHPGHPPSPFQPSRWLPAPLHLMSALAGLRYLSAAQKRQIRRGLWKLMRTKPAVIERLTASQWLTQEGQDPATIRLFWDVILVSALGDESNRVSMAAARKVFIDGFAAARGASDVHVPTRPLSELIGQSLASSIAQRGVRLVCHCPIDRLEPSETSEVPTDGMHGGVAWSVDGHPYRADDVIAAVPWYRIESLVQSLDDSIQQGDRSKGQDPSVVAGSSNDGGRLDRWGQFPSSPITGLHLWTDRPIMTLPHAVMVGTLSQWVFRSPCDFDRSSESSNDDRYYYQVVVSASRQTRSMSQQDLVDTVWAELVHAFPAAASAQCLAHRVVTDPRSVFSVTPDVQRCRPPARTALPWLHLAGDWIDTGWPATMEGAVISGRLAASEVLLRLGLPPCPVDAGLPRGWLARRLIR